MEESHSLKKDISLRVFSLQRLHAGLEDKGTGKINFKCLVEYLRNRKHFPAFHTVLVKTYSYTIANAAIRLATLLYSSIDIE